MVKTISIYHLITEKAPIEASASVSMAFTKSTALKERETPTAAPIPMKGFFDGADVFVGTTTFTTPLGRLLLKQQFLHQSLFLPRRVPQLRELSLTCSTMFLPFFLLLKRKPPPQ